MTLNLGQVQFPQIPKSSFWELCEVGAMQSTPLFAAVQDGAFRGSHIAILRPTSAGLESNFNR